MYDNRLVLYLNWTESHQASFLINQYVAGANIAMHRLSIEGALMVSGPVSERR